MKKLGVSVYPDYTGMDEIKAYLSSTRTKGYERVFTSMLLGQMGFEGAGKANVTAFAELATFCGELGMRLCTDADETTFDMLKASPADLSAFGNLGIHTVRVDGGFSPEDLILMSRNPWGICIEINASAALSLGGGKEFSQPLGGLLDEAIELGNPGNLSACHNFYPLPDTGLDMDTAAKVSAVFREKGIRTGGFAASQAAPPLLYSSGHGLPTVEAHRYLPPQFAAAELFAAGFDAVIIGDFPASPEELMLVAKAAFEPLAIPIVLDTYVDRNLMNMLFGKPLYSRGDQSYAAIRITDTRGNYVNQSRIGPRPAFTVTVCNERAGRYMGELQIALRDLGPSAEHNIIGFVHPDAERLLPYIAYGEREFTLEEYR